MSRSKFFRYDKKAGKVVEVKKETFKQIPRYPMPCEALAVHPTEIGEKRDWYRRNGVPTEFRGDGSPIVRDPSHYKKVRRLNGVHFRNGYES